MKKLISIIILAILVVVMLMLGKHYLQEDDSSPTIVEAIEKARDDNYVSYIIREVAFKDGVVVFFIRKTQDNSIQIVSEYVKKTGKGWKWGVGGGHSGSNLRLNSTDAEAHKQSFTYQYFPITEGTEFGKSPFPMIFGVVLNPDISRMVVKDSNRGLERQAEIVEVNKNFKLYYVFLDQIQGLKFDITGYNGEGLPIDTQSIDEGANSSFGSGKTDLD